MKQDEISKKRKSEAPRPESSNSDSDSDSGSSAEEVKDTPVAAQTPKKKRKVDHSSGSLPVSGDSTPSEKPKEKKRKTKKTKKHRKDEKMKWFYLGRTFLGASRWAAINVTRRWGRSFVSQNRTWDWLLHGRRLMIPIAHLVSSICGSQMAPLQEFQLSQKSVMYRWSLWSKSCTSMNQTINQDQVVIIGLWLFHPNRTFSSWPVILVILPILAFFYALNLQSFDRASPPKFCSPSTTTFPTTSQPLENQPKSSCLVKEDPAAELVVHLSLPRSLLLNKPALLQLPHIPLPEQTKLVLRLLLPHNSNKVLKVQVSSVKWLAPLRKVPSSL